MTTKELNDVLGKHKKWINDEESGKRANLRGANLRGADLWGASLRDANLVGANLNAADLTGADLRDADLRGAKLRGADLSGADLAGANLTDANLRDANLSGANLDFSGWPLWCGSFDVKVNKRIVAQLAYHFCRLDCDDPEYQEAKKALSKLANQFHRIDECRRIEDHA